MTTPASADVYSTAGALINRAAVRVGLSPATDPFSSPDPNFALMIELLNSIGEDLSTKVTNWNSRTQSFSTLAFVDSYQLPSGFLSMIDGSFHEYLNPSNIGFPVSMELFAEIMARGNGNYSGPGFPYIIHQGYITCPVFPEAGVNYVYRYLSTFWVKTVAFGSWEATASSVVEFGDVPLFDNRLLVAALVYEYQTVKGFDTTVSLRKYDDALASAIGNSRGASHLPMSGGTPGVAPDPFISSLSGGNTVLG
jgi:hypothetical protein